MAGAGAKAAAGRRSGIGSPGEQGFTMMEILIVVSILITLATIAAVSFQSLMVGTKRKATRSLIRRLQLSIEEYHQITGKYPPDGIDSTVRNQQGVDLRGSAALRHALTTPISYSVMIGGLPRQMRKEALMKLSESELAEENSDYPGVREIKDPFGTPIHYDNVKDRFRPQTGAEHYPPLEESEHPPDPRTLGLSDGGVATPGAQSSDYDLWSHGSNEHSVTDESNPIAIWNLSQ